MDNLDDLEEYFQKEIEDLDREFFNNIKKLNDRDKAIKIYREKLNNTRKNYEKKYKSIVDSQKKLYQKSKERKINKGNKNNEIFSVKKLDFNEIEKKEKSILKKDMFNFRMDLRTRKFHDRIPKNLLIIYFKSKIFYKSFILKLKKLIVGFFEFIKEKIILFVSFIKESFVKLYKLLIIIFQKIIGFLSKIRLKTKKKEEKDKKEEDKKDNDKTMNKIPS